MPEAKQQILVLGDSHSVALMAGCEAHGLKAEFLSFSGNFWHSGHIFAHRRSGLWARGVALQRRITDVLDRTGRGTLFGPDVFVIASFGFHLGRLVPVFGHRGHNADPKEFAATPERIFASSGMVAAYADHFRSHHFDLLRRIALRSPTVLVTPPRFDYYDGNYRAFFERIAAAIAEKGVPVYDPCPDLFPETGTIARELVTQDNVHGNAEYGARLIGRLIERGTLPAG